MLYCECLIKLKKRDTNDVVVENIDDDTYTVSSCSTPEKDTSFVEIDVNNALANLDESPIKTACLAPSSRKS